ncbi:hypothetical protein MLD38_022097 [Melastoma candidum]|uniref:Uncharacterized protein n=1 Tax=Melastoma candidum TaxID=119954 RepID=A0ACB9QL54_9MYRT|nr:hypothetical protein MLD38_022097 [Melastoma candidum]
MPLKLINPTPVITQPTRMWRRFNIAHLDPPPRDLIREAQPCRAGATDHKRLPPVEIEPQKALLEILQELELILRLQVEEAPEFAGVPGLESSLSILPIGLPKDEVRDDPGRERQDLIGGGKALEGKQEFETRVSSSKFAVRNEFSKNRNPLIRTINMEIVCELTVGSKLEKIGLHTFASKSGKQSPFGEE